MPGTGDVPTGTPERSPSCSTELPGNRLRLSDIHQAMAIADVFMTGDVKTVSRPLSASIPGANRIDDLGSLCVLVHAIVNE